MNAPYAAAICPTCKGSGHRTWAFDRTLLGGKRGKREQRCLACRGTGYVEPMRVCPTCDQWADVCTCPKNKIIKLETRDMGEQQGVRFVDGRWEVTIYKDRKAHYLGRYISEEAAIQVRQAAENLPVSDFPAIKARFKQYTWQGQSKVAAQPVKAEDVVEAEVADLDTDEVLHQKLVTARAADQRFQVIREQYCAAERDAVEAWNEYARELAASGQSDAFAKSYLGFLSEEINRP